MPDSELLVVCLCAQWCGVCREYDGMFKQVAARFAHARFLWIDVEDQADLVDPIEVETFPTILIAVSGHPVFFGALAPQAATLERLVRDRLSQSGAAPTLGSDLQSLVQRLSG